MNTAGSCVSGWYILKDQLWDGYQYFTMSKYDFEKWLDQNKDKIEKYNVKPI